MRNVETGSVIDVRSVVIEGDDSGIGRYSGGATGAVLAGDEIGGGTGAALAAIAGGTLGAIAGREVEEMITRQDGYEITIRLDSGRIVSIIQPASVYVPAIGDAVLVTGGEVRLNPQSN
jgi:outer membrane lipoprotein SlyB